MVSNGCRFVGQTNGHVQIEGWSVASALCVHRPVWLGIAYPACIAVLLRFAPACLNNDQRRASYRFSVWEKLLHTDFTKIQAGTDYPVAVDLAVAASNFVAGHEISGHTFVNNNTGGHAMSFTANAAILLATLYLAGAVEFARLCLLAPEASALEE